MRTKDFLSRLDHDRIVQAIKDAETKTSGEIRVYVQRGQLEGDALPAAQARFQRLGMHQTNHRNAVLIFVVPRAHKFAVVGDEGIHQRCGEAFWRAVVEKMGWHFRDEKFTDAIVHAISELGAALAQHFPRGNDDRDELPDSVIEDTDGASDRDR